MTDQRTIDLAALLAAVDTGPDAERWPRALASMIDLDALAAADLAGWLVMLASLLLTRTPAADQRREIAAIYAELLELRAVVVRPRAIRVVDAPIPEDAARPRFPN